MSARLIGRTRTSLPWGIWRQRNDSLGSGDKGVTYLVELTAEERLRLDSVEPVQVGIKEAKRLGESGGTDFWDCYPNGYVAGALTSGCK